MIIWRSLIASVRCYAASSQKKPNQAIQLTPSPTAFTLDHE
jgi:hypothetical protein